MKKFLALTMALTLLSTNLVFANTTETEEGYLPARETGERLGYTISWDGNTGSVGFTKKDTTYTATVNSNEYKKNGEVVLVDDLTVIIDNLSYIPMAFAEDELVSDYYITLSEEFLSNMFDNKFEESAKWFNGIINADQLQSGWESSIANLGNFKLINKEKYEVNYATNDEIGEIINVIQYVEFENSGITITYTYDLQDNLYGFVFNYYTLEEENSNLPTGIKEEDYTVGVNKTQRGKLTTNATGNSNTVVILVAGSGASDFNEEIYGNKPFQDIAWGLAEEGIDSFRYDKSTYAVANGALEIENPSTYTVEDEYLIDVKEITNMLTNMGYENIYLLGHSQGGMLAPRLYEDNDQIYKGLILLAGSPRTLSEIIIDQANATNLDGFDEANKTAYIQYIEEETKKIENLESYTEEELLATTIFNMPAYYLKEMNSYNTGEIAKNINKPILVLQGAKDFQVYVDPDYNLWKEVLKDNGQAEFILYDNLGHLFTQTSENPTNTVADYVPAQTMDSKVIEDIVNFIQE